MTIKTNWDTMQQYRDALSTAKWRKEVRAKHMEEIRNAAEYMRSLRHWLKIANLDKTLKARKANLISGMELAHMLAKRVSAYNCCEWQLVGDSCQSNLRNAISWAQTATGSPTFKDWQECCDSAEACIEDALVQLDVAHSKLKALWKDAKATMIGARKVISYCAKDILAPVALTKAQKVEIMKRNITVANYNQRVPVARNNYQLVSAAACISQRQEGTTLNTKLWLRLVRTTRYNHINRNAHNWNNRQDYLVRLPVYPVSCLKPV